MTVVLTSPEVDDHSDQSVESLFVFLGLPRFLPIVGLYLKFIREADLPIQFGNPSFGLVVFEPPEVH